METMRNVEIVQRIKNENKLSSLKRKKIMVFIFFFFKIFGYFK